MKRLISLLLAAGMALGITACRSQVPESAAEELTTPTTIVSDPTPLPTLPRETVETIEAETTMVDLTALSSTMVYAEVFAMMSSPEEYVGKTVKMRGIFSRGQLYAGDGSLDDGDMVFACVIQDATACCAQGIPFDLAGDYSYPQDYPTLGDTITVVGTFEIYEQNGLQFCRLGNAKFVQ